MKAAVTAALLLFASTIASAAEGLDLIVLLDRSSSMTGDAIIGTLLQRMTLDLVARNAANNHVDHRMAVISFGSSPTVEVPFTSTRSSELPALQRRLAALPAASRGDTAVLAAFIAAKELLRTLPEDPSRRRAIVLLTDGIPYVRGADMDVYRARLQQFVEAELIQRRVSIDVLLIGDRHDRKLWEKLTRNVHAVPPEADAVLAEAHGVIARLAGTRTSESAASKTVPAVDTLFVPPYLDIVVFDVFRASPGAEVEIFPPAAIRPIRGGTAGVEAVTIGDVMATFVVPRPAPGEWKIVKSRRDARVRILSQQFFPRGSLIRPAPAEALRQHDRIALAYRVIDEAERSIDELRGYPLSIEIVLSKPDGTTSQIAMQRDPSRGRAVFGSVEEAECDLAGRYWTDAHITTTDANGRLEIFRDRWSGFSVAPAKRVDCRVRASMRYAWLPPRADVDCAIGNDPVDMSAIANGSPAGLFRAYVSRNGQPAGAATGLHYLGGGSYRGTLRDAWSAGAYQLQVAADRSKLRAPYNIRFIPARLAFVRRTGSEWLLVPLAAGGTLAGLLLARRKTRS